jgi:single-strand DNA-binding protein
VSGVNKVIILGRLGKDPEMKDAKGVAICNFSVATSKEWKDDSGEKKEKTEWHRIVAFRKTAEICGKYLAKGRQVYIEGELQTRSWEGDDGVKKYSTEIVAHSVQFVGDNKPKSSDAVNSDSAPAASGFGGDTTTDEIPF